MFPRIIIFMLFMYTVFLHGATVEGKLTVEGDKSPMTLIVIMKYNPQSGQLSEYDSLQPESDGKWSFDLPDEGAFAFIALAADSQSMLDNYETRGYTPDFKMLSMDEKNIKLDFHLPLAMDVVFEAEKDNSVFNDPSIKITAVSDESFVPVLELETEGPFGKVPLLSLPVGKTYVFYVKRELPYSGKMMYRLDNEGVGYTADKQSALLIKLQKELALSAAARLDNLIKKSTCDVSHAEDSYENVLDLIAEKSFDKAAGKAIVAAEELIVFQARENITKHRTGNLIINVVDKNGNPLPRAQISTEQISSSFKFGTLASLYGIDEKIWETVLEKGFSYATVGTLWGDVQPSDDIYQWNFLDEQVGIPHINEMGFDLTGHVLLYFHESLTPSYLYEMNFEELKIEVSDHVEKLVTHYKNNINTWQLINEAHTVSASMGLSRQELTELTQIAAQEIKQVSGEINTMINTAPDWFGSSRINEWFIPGRDIYITQPIMEYYQHLIDENVPFDITGMQFYNGGCITLFADNNLSDEVATVDSYSLLELDRRLSMLESFEKPVEITELSIPSEMNPRCSKMDYWRNPWDEATQADYIEKFYTIAFAHKNMRAISWWDMFDENAFISSGGLMDENANEKEAFKRLTALLKSWTSEENTVSNSVGSAELQLFGGKHLITVSSGEDISETVVAVKEQTNTEITVKLDQTSAPGEKNNGGCSLFLLPYIN